MSNKIVPITAMPLRPRNMAPRHLQEAFINEARLAMGQPLDNEELDSYLRKRITVTFNGGRLSKTGTLTRIIRHPSSAGAVTYLVLDHDETLKYSLNSIQSIELVDGPPELEQS